MPFLSKERLAKIECLASGVKISGRAAAVFIRLGRPLTLSSLPTTSGVTFRLEGAGYVNAPFADPFAKNARFKIDHDGSGFVLRRIGFVEDHPVDVLPVPAYAKRNKAAPGNRIVMTHADRVRLSPVSGCAFRCGFCNIPSEPYGLNEHEILLQGLLSALGDPDLPAAHAFISGGTPARRDQPFLDAACELLLRTSPVPVDVMMTPRPEDPLFVDRLVGRGVFGLAINIEFFGERGRAFIPEKNRIGLPVYGRAIERAVELTGGKGRVRSLLVTGVEPPEATLAGVRWLAERGCDPVLSPFRPAPGTLLAGHPAPSASFLAVLWRRAGKIARRHGVEIGPRCVPCQHNTLAFPGF
ncbi:MAG: radical SAM protein [Alphaproteobacteria bacterium]|nr:radical SAM protein [Alphaproteobacteria bacterium]